MNEETIENARKYFAMEYNCTQAVSKAILENKGLFFDELPQIAAGFGGGISRRGEICGAITGAIMGIGMLTFQFENDLSKHKAITYEKVSELISKFIEIHGAPFCNELVGFDIRDPEARRKGNEEGVFKKICPKFVETATKIVLEMFP
ncbi:MAG: C_GCAxxG_C_C family protein [Asgard group archaeon]|nr:C_GCAxxG_C_C family protein [Asgard group archaeon]